MGRLVEIFTPLHKKAVRDYVGRMCDDKVACMKQAREYGQDFWDGDRRFGYGGYRYDGRWQAAAQKLVEIYGLKPDARILDVGCGKAHLLYELSQLLPDADVCGFDISDYALANAKEEIRDCLFRHCAEEPYPFPDQHFDLVLAVNTLHNLILPDVKKAFQEIERVGKAKYFCTESFRNEQELFNLQCWALTCETFLRPEAWRWLFDEFGYTGDYEFIYFQ